MIRVLLRAFVFHIALLLQLASAGLFAQVEWVPKLDQALKLAQNQGKLVVIDVTASWCPPCQQMDREVYPSKEFAEFSRTQIFMRLDADNNAEGVKVASKYDVHAYPTILVLNAKGEEIQRLSGGRNTEQLIGDLKAIFENLESLKRLVERAKQAPDDFKLQSLAGERCLERDDFDHAIQFLSRAVSLSSAQAQDDRVRVLLRLSDACFQNGKYPEASKAQDELLKLDPALSKTDDLKLRRARTLIALKRYDEGTQLIQEVLKLSKAGEDKESARKLLAQVPKKYRQTDLEFAKTLEKAQSQLKAGKLNVALDLASEAAAHSPLAADAHVLLAVIHFRELLQDSIPGPIDNTGRVN